MSYSFETPWTVACQTPLSTGFRRQEYRSGLPFSSSRNLHHQGIKPASSSLQGDSWPLSHWGSPICLVAEMFYYVRLRECGKKKLSLQSILPWATYMSFTFNNPPYNCEDDIIKMNKAHDTYLIVNFYFLFS